MKNEVVDDYNYKWLFCVASPENMLELRAFRRLRHWSATGNQAVEYLLWPWAWTALGMDLVEKARSCFWRTSFAKAGEEMTTVVFRPSFKHIIGPYILASLARDLWGLSPSFRRLPMTGSGIGPGGSFGLVLLLFISKWRDLSKVMVDKTYRIKINNSMIANQTRSQRCSFSRYYLLQPIFRYNTKECWHLLL